MSEYQYYEFLSIDRALDPVAQQALRSISSRARITATSFTNHYEWGNLKGDPRKFMERWFDLHLYVANWNIRRLMIRVPRRLVPDTSLLLDLQALAAEEGSKSDFNRRLTSIRTRHEKKGKFIERLSRLGASGDRTMC